MLLLVAKFTFSISYGSVVRVNLLDQTSMKIKLHSFCVFSLPTHLAYDLSDIKLSFN